MFLGIIKTIGIFTNRHDIMTLEDIKSTLDSNNIEMAINALTDYIKENPLSDEAYFMRGNAYRRLNDWKNAISNYCEAMDINPDSPATEAYKAVQEILGFYNTDLYNP